MATSHALELWEQGKFLHDILGYGQDEFESLIEKVLEIANKNLDHARSFVEVMVPDDKAPHVMEMIDLFEQDENVRGFMTNINPMELVRSILKLTNQSAVQEGRKIALGYRHPRDVNDFPVPIPVDVWNGSVEWKESTVYGGGLWFHSVRLVNAPDIQPTTKKPVGRPSREAVLLKAYRWGHENEMIDLSHSKTSIYEKVREIIKFQFPREYADGKGLGDTPMKKYLSNRIDQERLKCNAKEMT